jgi:hypothetical protein
MSRDFSILALGAALLGACSTDHLSPVPPTTESQAAGRPATAAALTATATSWNFVVLSWANDTQQKGGWEVYKSTTGPSGTFVKLADVPPWTVRYEENQLLAETEYCYKIRWYRITGKNTTYGSFAAACVTTPAYPRPSTPAIVSLKPVGSGSAQIDWDTAVQTTIRVERSTDAGATWTAVAIAQPVPHYYVDGGLVAEQRVCYRLIGFDALAESFPSAMDCTIPPAAPSNFTVVDLDEATYEVRWNDNSAVETQYEIWIFGYRWNDYFNSCYDEIGGSRILPANSTSVVLSKQEGFGGISARSDGGVSDWINVRIEMTPPPGPLCWGLTAHGAKL